MDLVLCLNPLCDKWTEGGHCQDCQWEREAAYEQELEDQRQLQEWKEQSHGQT